MANELAEKKTKKPLLNIDEDMRNADWIKWRTPDVDVDGKPIQPETYPDSGKERSAKED